MRNAGPHTMTWLTCPDLSFSPETRMTIRPPQRGCEVKQRRRLKQWADRNARRMLRVSRFIPNGSPGNHLRLRAHTPSAAAMVNAGGLKLEGGEPLKSSPVWRRTKSKFYYDKPRDHLNLVLIPAFGGTIFLETSGLQGLGHSGSDSTANERRIKGQGEKGFSTTSMTTTCSRDLGSRRDRLFSSHSFPTSGRPVLYLTGHGREPVSDERQSRGHFLGFLFYRQASASEELKRRTNENKRRRDTRGPAMTGLTWERSTVTSTYWAPDCVPGIVLSVSCVLTSQQPQSTL